MREVGRFENLDHVRSFVAARGWLDGNIGRSCVASPWGSWRRRTMHPFRARAPAAFASAPWGTRSLVGPTRHTARYSSGTVGCCNQLARSGRAASKAFGQTPTALPRSMVHFSGPCVLDPSCPPCPLTSSYHRMNECLNAR